MNFAKICLICSLMLAVVAGPSCSTKPVVPPTVHAQAASFDEGQQNSGLVGYDDSTGLFITTKQFHTRYLALANIYGSRFVPPLDPARGVSEDGTRFTPEAIHSFQRMNRWRRQELSPTAATPAPEGTVKRVIKALVQ